MTHSYWMIGEIREGPAAFRETLGVLDEVDSIACEVLSRYRCIVTCSSGSSHHAGLCLSYAVSRLAGLESFSTLSSEYSEHIHSFLGKDHLLVAISQSGESADTVRASRLASEKGVDILAITGRRDSALGSLARYVVEVRGGVERAVPATKSFLAQLAAVYSLAVGLASARSRDVEVEEARRELARMPEALERALELSDRVMGGLSSVFSKTGHVFILGYGPSYVAALEAALKLKETCGIRAEAYSVREFRHGPISLLGRDTACIFIIPPDPGDTLEVFERVATTAESTGTKLMTFSHEESGAASELLLPRTLHVFATAVEVVPFQLLAYYTALERALDPDSPRLLSKIVK